MRGHVIATEKEVVMSFKRNKGFIKQTMRECECSRKRLKKILRKHGVNW